MYTRSGFAPNGAPEDLVPAWHDAPEEPTTGPAPLACAQSLRRTIEAEIIPRLMLAHLQPVNDEGALSDGAGGIGAEEVAALSHLILARDAAPAQEYVRSKRASGVPLAALYLDLLSPVAQRLGAMWEADLCDFTEVTLGLWRLQQIVFEHSASFQREPGSTVALRRALLVPAPGSQHTFGALMVGEFFRRAGWDARGDPKADARSVAKLLAGEWFDVLGLSFGSTCDVDQVASDILVLRKASMNPAVVVLVGGPAVAHEADFVERVGADGTAPDAASAVNLAESLVASRAGPT